MGTEQKINADDWGREGPVVVARSLEGEQVTLVTPDGRAVAIVGAAGVAAAFDQVAATAGQPAGRPTGPLASSDEPLGRPAPVDLGAAWLD